MRQSKVEVFLHIVWATHERMPFLSGTVKTSVYNCIGHEAVERNCKVIAFGGMPDHVHLLVRIPSTISVADLVGQIKGATSHFVNHQFQPKDHFRWQHGYGCFSVSRSHVIKVQSYIENQEQHHSSGRIWEEWEAVDEEVEPVVKP